MEFCKLQIGCLMVVLYIAFSYYKECSIVQKKHRATWFDGLLLLSIICIIFDGITAYTVNHLDTVNGLLNDIMHMLFLAGIDMFIFTVFLYMLAITEGLPKTKLKKLLLYSPIIINVLLVVSSMPSLEYRIGEKTNYSMGVPAYTCFVMAGIYILFLIGVFIKRWRYIEKNKRSNISLYLLVVTGVTVYQMFIPEALITSIGFTVLILGIYINYEDPAKNELSHYHHEMVMGFATLVENRDGNTGGHIRRTSRYAEMLAKELRDRGYYKSVLTKDYIKNLLMAAPMHDIGKISVPDSILQKPGKLTEEEFEIMKCHAANGGKIIKETFGNLGNVEYRDMAYEMAMYHHEKWNGKGYPKGLKEEEIPLSARIMAVVDVFDAISQKRCYRDAMPIEQCFEIIREGSGKHFEPLIAETFLNMREAIVKEIETHTS